MDVQRCCGVHGLASLCGGRVRPKITHEVNFAIKITMWVVLCSGDRRPNLFSVSKTLPPHSEDQLLL